MLASAAQPNTWYDCGYLRWWESRCGVHRHVQTGIPKRGRDAAASSKRVRQINQHVAMTISGAHQQTRSLPRSSGSASKPPTIRIHQQPSRHDPQSCDSPLDGVRAEPAARALFRTSAGSQSVKLGSAQSIVRPISEFATGPLRPRYNITPTTTIDVIRLGEHGRELVPMSWGLIALNV
jgi:hypothetical protein